MKRPILAVVLSSIALFMWGTISWVVMSWHTNTMNTFSDEVAMQAAIKAAAPTKGIYVLPMEHGGDMKAPEFETHKERYSKGAVMFAAVVPDGIDPESMAFMGWGYLINLETCFIIVLLVWLVRSALVCPKKRLFFTFLLAWFPAYVNLVYWNYWWFATDFTMVNIIDNMIGAIVVAAIVTPLVKPDEAAAA